MHSSNQKDSRQQESRTEYNSPTKMKFVQQLKPALKVKTPSINIDNEQNENDLNKQQNDNYLSPNKSLRQSPVTSNKKISFTSTDSQTIKQIENVNNKLKKELKNKKKRKKKKKKNNLKGDKKEIYSPTKQSRKKKQDQQSQSESEEEQSSDEYEDDEEDYDEEDEQAEEQDDSYNSNEDEQLSSKDKDDKNHKEKRPSSVKRKKKREESIKIEKKRNTLKKLSYIEQVAKQNEEQFMIQEQKQLERIQNLEKEQAILINQSSQLKTFEQKNKDLELKLKKHTIILSQAKNNLQIQNKDFINQNIVEIKSNNFQGIRKTLLIKIIIKLFKCKLFLRNQVRKIANTQGRQTEQHFQIIMNNINYLFICTIIFVWLYIVQILFLINNMDQEELGFYSLMETKIREENVEILNICTFLFIIFTIIKVIIKYKSTKLSEVEYLAHARNLVFFRLAFSEWNWTLSNTAIDTQKSQISLKNKVNMQLKESLSNLYLQNKKSTHWFLYLISFLFTSGFLILGLWSVNKVYELNIIIISEYQLVNEIIKGIIICYLSLIFSNIAQIFTCLEQLPMQQQRLQSNTIKKYLVQQLMIAFYCFLNIASYKSKEQEWFSIIYNYNTDQYKCYAEQIGYVLYGLLLGQFIILIVNQYLIIFSKFIYSSIIVSNVHKNSKLQDLIINFQEFEVISSTIPLIIQNCICLILLPFSPFSFIIGCILQLIHFYHNRFIVQKYKIPHFTRMNRTEIQSSLTKFEIISYFIALLIFGFTDDLQLSRQIPQEGQVQINNDGSQKIEFCCGPYISDQNSSFSQMINYLFQGNLEYFFNIIFWNTFLAGTALIFLTANFIKNQVLDYWQQEFKKKSKEIQLMKNLYEQKIKIMERKIQQVQQEIDQNLSTNSPLKLQNNNLLNIIQTNNNQILNTEASETGNLVEQKDNQINLFNQQRSPLKKMMTKLDFKNLE